MTGGTASVTDQCLMIREVTEGFTAGMNDICIHNLNEGYQRKIGTYIYNFSSPERTSGHEQPYEVFPFYVIKAYNCRGGTAPLNLNIRLR